MKDPRVLLAASVGHLKAYCLPFLLETIQGLEGVEGVHIAFDGIDIPVEYEAFAVCDKMPPLPKRCRWKDWPSARASIVRSAARKHFLQHPEFTHIYFHDADMIPPADIIPRLLERDAPIATGIYNLRNFDYVVLPASLDTTSSGLPPSSEDLWGFPPGPESCYLSGHFGMGCMLIRRDVVEATPFRRPNWIVAEHGSEDVQFCRDARANGFSPVLIDTSLSCWHMSERGGGSRIHVERYEFGTTWADNSCQHVQNKSGAWTRGIPRQDLSNSQLRELGPGFVSGCYPVMTLEFATTREIVSGMITPFEKTVEQIPYQYPHPKILHGLIRWLQPQVVVEIGTHIGYAACWMARAIQENNSGRLYCIDPFCWVNETQQEQWEANLTACGVRDWATLIKGRSEEVEWPAQIDMAFVDGNHTYPVCRYDALKAKQLGARCIVLHDTVAWEGSRKYAEEMRTSPDWEGWDFLEEMGSCGIMICLRRDPKPESWGEDIGEKWDVPTKPAAMEAA